MTLDEAIKHAEEVAEQNEWFEKNYLESIQCKECAEEHRQLAEWLKELKEYREQEPKTGHWKRISIDKYSEHAKYWYRCDRCGKDNLGNTDWCPNCGAKMEVENG